MASPFSFWREIWRMDNGQFADFGGMEIRGRSPPTRRNGTQAVPYKTQDDSKMGEAGFCMSF